MGGKHKKITTGYRYHIGFHAGLGIRMDALLDIRGAKKTAWFGEITESGTITVAAPNLFGGDADQGGMEGDVDVMFGEATQQPNAYLLSAFGSQVPGWRGVATLVWKGGVFGSNNPFPQRPDFLIRAIKNGWGDVQDDSACWYPEKADVSVAASSTLPANADGWDYQVLDYAADPGYNDLEIPTDGWNVDGQGPFGSNIAGETFNTLWPQDTILWVRRTITVASGANQTLTVIAENGCVVFINGALVGAVNRSNVQIDNNQQNTFTFPVQSGQTYEIAIKAFDEHPSVGGVELRVSIDSPGLTAMNPAHILYYARTHPFMGREAVEAMHDVSFKAGADWFYDQGFGLCTEYDPSTESAEQFIARIEKVAGCSMSRSPVDGLWYLDIANGEYDLDSLPILTDDDILEFSEQPTIPDEAANSISVEYYDPLTDNTPATPPVQAMALVDSFGPRDEVVQFHEVPTSGLALRLAQRTLAERTTPTHGFDLTTTRKTASWRRGIYFRLQCPKRGIADMVCGLGSKQSGTLKSGAIKITAAQDIYSLPASSFVEAEPGVDTRPSPVPLGIIDQIAFEAPYFELVRSLSRADLAAVPSGAGYLMTAAKDPGTSRDYTIETSTDGGTTYADEGDAPWCPSAIIVEGDELTDAEPATDFTLSGGSLLSSVSVGSAALWNGEMVRVDAIDATAGTLTLGRGCADTPPLVHAAGARIWFFDGFAGADTSEYTDGEAIDVELLTNTGSAQLDPDLATPMALTFDQRQFRPYPPAFVQINGDWYPSEVSAPISVTFNHRDRVGQADQLLDYSAASVGPETGTSYTLRGYLNDALDATVADQSGSPIAWSPEGTGSGRIELVSVRDGVESHVWEHAFSITGVVPLTTTPTASVADTAARVSFRASAAATVALKYSTNADLSEAVTAAGIAVGDSTDFTGAIDLADLEPDTTYYYTPRSNGADQYSAPYPSFKTFPAAGTPVSFSLAFGSCTKHSGVGADSIFDAVPAEVRFLVLDGDTVYADSDTPAASTLADYRSKQQFALEGDDTTTAGWKALRARMPVFTMWDDHDITNDFSGGTSDPLYAPAKQAFQEYQGRANPDPLTAGELYYTLQYGDVGFFVCDLRSFRSANTATDDADKTILGATQKAALKNWLLTNNASLKFKVIYASVPAHGYASNTAGDSWGGVDDGTQLPNGANGFRTERNEIWDFIDANQISGVLFASADQHWAGSFVTTYAGRPRYEVMASPFNSPLLTEVARAADPVNGPVFWKYDATMNFGKLTFDTTVSPPTVAFQLYSPSGSLGPDYLTNLDLDQIDLDLVPVPGIEITTDLPAATNGESYTGSITATNVNGATGAITLIYDELPEGMTLGARTGTGDGPFTWPVTASDVTEAAGTPVTNFSATNGTAAQDAALKYTWEIDAGEVPWTPADLAVPPIMWQKETSTITQDINGHAQTWGDVTGNNNFFGDWGGESRHPTILASGQNGKRVLSFDGVANALGGQLGTSNALALTNNISVLSLFVAGSPAKTSASFARVLSFARGTDGSVRAGIWGGSNNITAYQRRLDANAAAGASIAQPDSNWHVYQSEHDWTAATVGIRMDGGALTSTATGQGSGSTSATNSSEVDLMGSGSTSGQFAAGALGEVIVLNYIPSAADRQKIEGYLEWRWGTQANLPADHPYKDAAPTA